MLLKKIYFNLLIKKNKSYNEYFFNKQGLEVGGPSNIFRHEVPIYSVINKLDGCNFTSQTIWEGDISEGYNYKFYKNNIGYQYISEASNLIKIPDEKYDFIIASHCLEHCANPLQTLKEWLRVINNDGIILLVLPHRDFTFDHNRPVTNFAHLLQDYYTQTSEDDLTHVEEILEFHDLSIDTLAGSKEQFKKRSLDNYTNRCLHHHVYDFKLLEDMFDFLNINVIKQEFMRPNHQIIIGKKSV